MDLQQLQTSTGTVAGRLLDALAEVGVEYIFGNPGTTELPLLATLSGRALPRYVMSLHDGVAVGMAHGYAQVSRRLGVVNLHAAPGLANAMGNLYNACRSGVPLLITAGMVSSRLALYDPPLAGDLVALARPLTRWAYELRTAGDLLPALRKAIDAALTPPGGPVFLGLPVDLLEETIPAAPLALPRRVEPLGPDPSLLAGLAEELVDASEPLMVVGERAARPDVQPLLVELAQLLGLPVRAERIPPRLPFPTDHPLWAGALPAAGAALGRLLTGADRLLVVGASRLAPVLWAAEWQGVPTVPQIRLEESPGALLEGVPAHQAVVGPFSATLQALVQAVREVTTRDPSAGDRLRVRRSRVEASLGAIRRGQGAGQGVEDGVRPGSKPAGDSAGLPDSRPETEAELTASSVVAALDDALPADAVVVEEALTSTRALVAQRTFRDPDAFHGIKGTALGWGLPAAVGAKLARPARTVVGFVGDGSALYAFQALWTAAHQRLRLPVLVLRNGEYRILREGFPASATTGAVSPMPAASPVGAPGAPLGGPQSDLLRMGLGPPYPDYVELARGLGVPARRIRTADQLREGLAWALEQTGPAVLEVWIAPSS